MHHNMHRTKYASRNREAYLHITYLFSMVPGGGFDPPRSCDLRILSPLRLPISPSGRCEFYRAGSTEEVIDLAGCCVSPQVDPSIITRGSMNRGPWLDSRPEVPASRF